METRDTSFEFDMLRLEKKPDRLLSGYFETADNRHEQARVNLLPQFEKAAKEARRHSRHKSNTFNSPYKRKQSIFEDFREEFFERDAEESDKKSCPSARDNRSIIRYLDKSSLT